MPALLTSTLSRGNSPTAQLQRATRSTSPATSQTRSFSSGCFACASRSFSSRRPQRITSLPAARNRSASAKPMPEAPPVTRMMLEPGSISPPFLPAQHAAGKGARRLLAVVDLDAVDPHTEDAGGGEVRRLGSRPVRDRRRIEQYQVRVGSLPDHAAVPQAGVQGRQPRHLLDGGLQGEQALLAHVAAQDARKRPVAARMPPVILPVAADV